MSLQLFNISLHSNERVVKVVRQEKTPLTLSFLVSFLVYLNAFFFLFKFISWGAWGLILFGFLLFSGTFYAFYKFYFWYFNAVVLTNQRIIDIHQKRFLERITSDVAHHRIKDAIVKIKGFRQILTRTGSVLLVLDGGSDNLEFCHIKNPEKVRELILKIRADEAENPPYSPFQKGGDGGGFDSPFDKGGEGGFKNEKIGQICEEIRNLDEEVLTRILARLPEIIKEESESLFFTQINTNKNTDGHK